MKDYCRLPTCETCEHVFVNEDYDEEDEYYCHIDKSDRPQSGSMAMGENGWDYTGTQVRQLSDIIAEWTPWAESHAVHSNGYCSKYKGQTEWQGTLSNGDTVDFELPEGTELTKVNIHRVE